MTQTVDRRAARPHSSKSRATGRTITQINWRDADSAFTITPEGGDSYVLQASEVIDRLTQAQKSTSNLKQVAIAIKALQDRIGDWFVQNQEKVSEVYLTMRAGRMMFLVVTKDVLYDEELHKRLISLDTEVARSETYVPLKMETLSIPAADEQSIEAFVDPTFCKRCRLGPEKASKK